MKHVLTASIAAASIAAIASADMVTVDYNVDSVNSGVVVEDTISLPSIASIDSVAIDIAQTWGGDLEMTLTSPTGDVFTFMFDEVDSSGSGNFDMGLVPGDGSLANVDAYTFVETGGLTEYAEDFAPGGTYNANAWASGGWDAGDWTLLINDDAGGDDTSIGSVTITYTIPAPGAIALLGLAGIAGGRRRRA